MFYPGSNDANTCITIKDTTAVRLCDIQMPTSHMHIEPGDTLSIGISGSRHDVTLTTGYFDDVHALLAHINQSCSIVQLSLLHTGVCQIACESEFVVFQTAVSRMLGVIDCDSATLLGGVWTLRASYPTNLQRHQFLDVVIQGIRSKVVTSAPCRACTIARLQFSARRDLLQVSNFPFVLLDRQNIRQLHIQILDSEGQIYKAPMQHRMILEFACGQMPAANTPAPVSFAQESAIPHPTVKLRYELLWLLLGASFLILLFFRRRKQR